MKKKKKNAFYLAFHGFTDEVDAPETSVLVAGVERLERVTQVGLGGIVGQVGSQVGTTAMGTIPRANDRVGYHQGNIIGIDPAASFHSDGNVGERHIVVANANFRSWRRAEC